MHTDDRTDAAADDGKHEKRGFRDAPGAFPGFELIDSHNGETYKIDDCQIYDNKCNYVHC